MSSGNLPVRTLRYNVLHYFENAHPEFKAELESEIKFNELSPKIVYDDSKSPVHDYAEIAPDHTITIFEPFLAFLWTFSHISVSFYYEQNEPIEIIEKGTVLDRAVDCFMYGLSLFQKWSEWSHSLPNPEKPDPVDKYVDPANGVFMIAAAFVILHEYAHHVLGHDLRYAPDDKNQAHLEEKAADRYAAETLLSGNNDHMPTHGHTLKVGIIIGLCSIIFSPDGWHAGDDHPKPDERFAELLTYISGGDEEHECWAWLGSAVVAWAIVNGKAHQLTLTDSSRKQKAMQLIELAQQP